MRAMTCVVASMLAGICQPALAQTATERTELETLLRQQRITQASAALDRIIDAHLPSDGTPRPDPGINALVGQFLLARGQAEGALGFFQAAHRTSAAPEDEARLFLGEGRAYLIAGDTKAALSALDRGRALSASPDTRAALTRARLEALLASDPRKALEAIPQAAPERAADPQHEWEWAILDAQARMLTGKPEDARAAADHAWSAAARAPLVAAAPSRAGALMGVLAAQSRDRDAALSLIASAAGTKANDGKVVLKLVDYLPVCGKDVAPADTVMVALYRDGDARAARVTPLWATRPQIVRTFLDGLDARRLLEDEDIGVAALVATLRCRTAPSSRQARIPAVADKFSAWSASRGLLPRFDDMGDPAEQLTAASKIVDTLTDRYGADSLLLIGPLAKLGALTAQRFATQHDVAAGRIIDINGRILTLIRKAGGTESFLPTESNPLAMFGKMAGATSLQEAKSIASAGYRDFLNNTDFGTAFTTYKATSTAFLTPEERTALLATLVSRAQATSGAKDPRLLPLRLDQVAEARSRQDWPSMARYVAQSGLAADLCDLREAPPEVTGNAISTDDFPTEGVIADMTGRSALEFDVDAAGKNSGMRVIATMPSFLFDPAIAAKGATISFAAATMAGKPVGCRGRVQMIRWKFPEDDDEDGSRPFQTWTPGS